jgi:hypothetical protein
MLCAIFSFTLFNSEYDMLRNLASDKKKRVLIVISHHRLEFDYSTSNRISMLTNSLHCQRMKDAQLTE